MANSQLQDFINVALAALKATKGEGPYTLEDITWRLEQEAGYRTDHLSAALECMDQLTDFLTEAHQDELDRNHYGDSPSNCSYCEAMKEAKEVKNAALGAPRIAD